MRVSTFGKMLAKFVFLVIAITLAIDSAAAINCNFTVVENDESDSVQTQPTAVTRIVTASDSSEVFNCEQSFEDDFEFSSDVDSTKANWIDNRFNSGDSFELQEVSCLSSKRFITPRALNNIYNRLTTVINNSAFVQKIQITECRTAREACNEHIYPSPSFRYICWQEYLIIKLQAYDLGNAYDENFYYPSHCSCRLVRVTRRHKKNQNV